MERIGIVQKIVLALTAAFGVIVAESALAWVAIAHQPSNYAESNAVIVAGYGATKQEAESRAIAACNQQKTSGANCVIRGSEETPPNPMSGNGCYATVPLRVLVSAGTQYWLPWAIRPTCDEARAQARMGPESVRADSAVSVQQQGDVITRNPADAGSATSERINIASLAPRSDADCTGATPIFDSNNCRARQASDCTGNTPILENGNCRVATREDCFGSTPDFVGGQCVAACPSGQVRNQAEACVQESWLALAISPDSVPAPEAAIVIAYNAATEAEAKTKAIEQCNLLSSSSTPCIVPDDFADAQNDMLDATGRGCAALQPYRYLRRDGVIRYDYEALLGHDLVNPLSTVIAELEEIFAEDITDNVRQRGARLELCTSSGRPLAYATTNWDSVFVTPMALTMTVATPTITIVVTAKAPDQGSCDNDGVMGTELNADGTACVCPSGKTLLSDGLVNACADPLPTAAANFLANDCISAGWLWEYLADPNGQFMQCCLVPSRVVNAPSPRVSLLAASADAPLSGGDVNRPASVDALQVSANSDVDACVMTQHSGFDVAAAGVSDIPQCNDQNLFASLGFPQKPADITHADILAKSKRITVQLAAGGAADATPDIVYNNTTLAHYSAPSGGGGGGGGGGAGIAIGVAAVVGLIALATWSGDSDSFTFSPDVGLNYDSQSGHILRYGSRVDFRENAWHAWWSAAQTNSRNGTGKLRYGSGAEYAGEFWNARLKSDAYGEKSDSAFSLSAEKELGVWSFVPLYRVQYAKDETDESWRHSLTLKAVWRVNQWTLTNSAGFYGKSLAAFGDNASAKILLRRDF